MNGELTDEAIEEGRIAIMNLERELNERANDAISTGSNKHHMSTTDERRILDQMPREARLNNRLESLGLTVEELDDRGLLDGGGSVPSYVTSLKNKSRRTLELQSRSHRLQGRDKETFTKLLNSFLHMIRTLVRKGLNLDVYCRRHDPNRRGLMRKKAFFTMLKLIGLPFTGRELQEITLHYMVPASDQADYVSLLKDARIVNLGSISNVTFDREQEQAQQNSAQPDESNKNTANLDPATGSEPDTGTSSPSREPVRGDMELGMHTLVLADVRRMLLESIRSLSKDQDDVYRMFARWDTQGTGTVTATQFLRVLARLHVDISDQDQDFLVELLDTNGMGRIDFEGLIAFCFASTPETDLLSPAGMLSGGGSLSVGEDNVNNETMSAVSTEGNTSVDQRSHTNGSSTGPNSRRPRTATLSRPYNEYVTHAHSSVHAATAQLYPTPQQQQQQQTYFHHNTTVEEQQQRAMQLNSNRANPRGIQRPLTASGRVSSAHDSSQSPSPQGGNSGARFFVRDQSDLGGSAHNRTQSLVMEYGHADRTRGMGDGRGVDNAASRLPAGQSGAAVRSGPQSSYAQQQGAQPQMRPASAQGQSHAQTLLQKHSGAGTGKNKHSGHNSSSRGPEGEDSQYVVELPDDVMYGEEKYLGSDSARIPSVAVVHKQQHNAQYNPPKPSSDGDRPTTNATGPRYSDITAHTKANDNAPSDRYYQHAHDTNNQREDSRSPDISNINNVDNMDNMQENMHDLADMGSFNDNTLITDQEEYFFGSPKEIPTLNNTRNLISNMNSMNLNNNGNNVGGNWTNAVTNNSNHTNSYGNNAGAPNPDPYTRNTSRPIWHEPSESTHRAPYQNHSSYNTSNEAENTNTYYNNTSSNNQNVNQAASPAEPIEHLVLLATQILSTLREIIMGRYRRGRSLQEIFEHFDRNEKQYFDSSDFITATADLRIETSPRVASIAVNMMALDGYDKVSFGEFKVFVLDSDHRLLELNVQEQLAQLLEQKGREYQSFMVDMFWNEEESLNDSTNNTTYNNNNNTSTRHPSSNNYRSDGFVSKIAFVSSLQRIGLVLTSSELNRLVDRFDVHGNEMCSVHRFVRMVQNSRAWHHGEKVLSYQDEALEEGEFLRQHLHHRHSNPSLHTNDAETSALPDLPLELIAMCEYLGIRVLSEPNMIWIAADALKAPLPVSWTAQKDFNGRTYFYNHLTNQTKLEHPLDPHFRKLRDKYRQGGANETGSENALGRVTAALPNTTANNNNKSVNSSISFGGIGAALNPPPLNQSLVGTARPSPPPNSFQHLYSHANGEHQNSAEYHFPRVNNYHQSNQQGQNNVSPSLQMMQDEDEVLYVKYGNMGRDQLPSSSGAKGGPSSGYGQQGQQNNPSNGPRNSGARRPLSALDRTQFSAQQQQQAKNHSRARDTTDASAPSQQAFNSSSHLPPNHNGAPSGLPPGFSAGIYTAELKALMGSAAYNRPVSAPQHHHIQAEKLHAYNDATQRMQQGTKEEQKRNSMELLEAVYTGYPKPAQRAQSSSAAAAASTSNTNMNRNNSRNASANDAEPKYSPNGGLNRSNSAKWSNNGLGSSTPNTTSTPLSVVDRALSIGRSGSNAYLPSRVEQVPPSNAYNNNNNSANQYQNSSNAPRERSRSANRSTRRSALPDEQTKQARLSEMFDEAILDKLDSAIGLHRR